MAIFPGDNQAKSLLLRCAMKQTQEIYDFSLQRLRHNALMRILEYGFILTMTAIAIFATGTLLINQIFYPV